MDLEEILSSKTWHVIVRFTWHYSTQINTRKTPSFAVENCEFTRHQSTQNNTRKIANLRDIIQINSRKIANLRDTIQPKSTHVIVRIYATLFNPNQHT